MSLNRDCLRCERPATLYDDRGRPFCQACYETEMLIEGERLEARRQLAAEDSGFERPDRD